MSLFIVDSNFFIQAHRAIYPLDIAKGFWEKVKKRTHPKIKDKDTRSV
jgi:hypothetical protein